MLIEFIILLCDLDAGAAKLVAIFADDFTLAYLESVFCLFNTGAAGDTLHVTVFLHSIRQSADIIGLAIDGLDFRDGRADGDGCKT